MTLTLDRNVDTSVACVLTVKNQARKATQTLSDTAYISATKCHGEHTQTFDVYTLCLVSLCILNIRLLRHLWKKGGGAILFFGPISHRTCDFVVIVLLNIAIIRIYLLQSYTHR
jgi:hypothetical protein